MEASDNNFSTIQAESVSTIDALSTHSNKIRDELETKLVTEIQLRKAHEKELVDKYNKFKVLIVNEMKLQTDQMENAGAETTSKAMRECNDILNPYRQKIADIKSKTRNADQLIDRAKQVESQIEKLSQSLHENMSTIGRQCSELNASIDMMKRDCQSALDSSKERLQMIGSFVDGKDFLIKEDVDLEYQKLTREMDQKISDIEAKIQHALDQVGDFSANYPLPQTSSLMVNDLFD